jgi:hypothetical protein
MRWETWAEASLVTLFQGEVEDYRDTQTARETRAKQITICEF